MERGETSHFCQEQFNSRVHHLNSNRRAGNPQFGRRELGAMEGGGR